MSAIASPAACAELVRGWPADLADLSVLALDECDSTQLVARRILDRLLEAKEDADPLIVVALAQSEGRGRRGRRWISPAGEGIWASLLLPTDRERLPALPARAAIALAQALGETVPGIRIKWPNDLLVGRRKLAGILVEVVSRGDDALWAIVGFGVNVGRSEGRQVAKATSLESELGGRLTPSLGAVLVACARGLRAELLDPPENWLDRYRRLSLHHPGEEMHADLDGVLVAGRYLGLDERGSLRLQLAEGERVLTSGDVFSW